MKKKKKKKKKSLLHLPVSELDVCLCVSILTTYKHQQKKWYYPAEIESTNGFHRKSYSKIKRESMKISKIL